MDGTLQHVTKFMDAVRLVVCSAKRSYPPVSKFIDHTFVYKCVQRRVLWSGWMTHANLSWIFPD